MRTEMRGSPSLGRPHLCARIGHGLAMRVTKRHAAAAAHLPLANAARSPPPCPGDPKYLWRSRGLTRAHRVRRPMRCGDLLACGASFIPCGAPTTLWRPRAIIPWPKTISWRGAFRWPMTLKRARLHTKGCMHLDPTNKQRPRSLVLANTGLVPKLKRHTAISPARGAAAASVHKAPMLFSAQSAVVEHQGRNASNNQRGEEHILRGRAHTTVKALGTFPANAGTIPSGGP